MSIDRECKLALLHNKLLDLYQAPVSKAQLKEELWCILQLVTEIRFPETERGDDHE